MIPVNAVAYTSKTACGAATVTNPAPIRAAARAASRPAPVMTAPPATSACPRVYLWLSSRGRGRFSSHQSGSFSTVSGDTASSTVSVMPIWASTVSPQRIRPGSSTCPGFLRKNVTVTVAWDAAPRTSPVPPSTPLGTSTATTGTARRSSTSITSRAAPSTGRASPAPKIASIASPAPSSADGDNGATGPHQRAAAPAASPFNCAISPSSASRTDQPRSARMRAATKPSPPLLPGPHKATTGRGEKRLETASATARPAFSINSVAGDCHRRS